jgi:hypothetical protein
MKHVVNKYLLLKKTNIHAFLLKVWQEYGHPRIALPVLCC